MFKTSTLKEPLKIIFKDTLKVTLTLFKIMIPTIIIVKILEELGVIEFIGTKISPFMSILGLPPEAGVIWMTTLCTNIYTGLAVFVQMTTETAWTQAQVTILGTIMLLAHNLPIEARVAQKSGCRIITNIFIRLSGALLLAFILKNIYSLTNYLQGPAVVAIPNNTEKGLFSWPTEILDAGIKWVIRNEKYSLWIAEQLIFCLQVYLAILVLIALLKLLRVIGVEKIVNRLLQPILRLLGIRPEATSITIVGITLGLAYGGGLLIQEAESGRVSKEDVFASVSLLSLCHSQIEDTLLVMLIGAHLSGILWGRLIFALIIVFFLVRFQKWCSPKFSDRFLVTDVMKKEIQS